MLVSAPEEEKKVFDAFASDFPCRHVRRPGSQRRRYCGPTMEALSSSLSGGKLQTLQR
jgi:hypothetical protein